MNWTRIILRIFIGLICVGALAYISSFALVSFILRDHHSLRNYPSLRAQWNPDLVAHFPDPIPESATLKKFSHFPGFMQGGAYIQLRLVLPPEEIQELRERYLQERSKSFFGGEWERHINEKDGMPTTFFRTGARDQRSFPGDYEIMIFDALLRESDGPHDWNHGKSHGVAVSFYRNEIVYWAESW